MAISKRQSRAEKSTLERLWELTENAKAEYLPAFNIEGLVVCIGKAAEEAANRGLYIAEYVFVPPAGSYDLKAVRTDLCKRLADIYTEARVYDSENEESVLDLELYEGVWVVCVSWRPEPLTIPHNNKPEED